MGRVLFFHESRRVHVTLDLVDLLCRSIGGVVLLSQKPSLMAHGIEYSKWYRVFFKQVLHKNANARKIEDDRVER